MYKHLEQIKKSCNLKGLYYLVCFTLFYKAYVFTTNMNIQYILYTYTILYIVEDITVHIY